MIESLEINDTSESRRKRDFDRLACSLHLRDLVRGHPKRASSSAILAVQTFEAAVVAKKAELARERETARAKKEMLALRELGKSEITLTKATSSKGASSAKMAHIPGSGRDASG